LTSPILYAATIFASGFLLFIVQPIIARQILPWFGGASGVWTTCLMFFQVALVAGYAYSNWTTRRLTPPAQARLHMGLLIVSVLFLPVLASPTWKPSGGDDPTWRILGLLAATIGLPYFVLCTTGPLVQAWFAREFPGRRVYRLFALSNLASLAALASYPFLIEPRFPTTTQAQVWSIGYGAFAVLCLAAAAPGLRRRLIDRPPPPAPEPAAAPLVLEEAGPAPGTAADPTWRVKALWLILPAMGTWLLLAVTNHITQNIASVPFLWMLPLTLYLASFIICFDHERWYHRGIWVAPALGLLVWGAYGLQTDDVTLNVRMAVPLYAGGLFAWCVFCHGELARLKPAARDLTSYYLMIALGGALGGVFVGLVAPRVFASSYELGIGLVVTALLAVFLLRRLFFFSVSMAALAVAVLAGHFAYEQIENLNGRARVLERNFYGTLRTEDWGTPEDWGGKRQLVNGVILHGEQYLSPERRMDPTSYYGPTSGIATALRLKDRPGRRVGVIGLGAGALAVYGRRGDHFDFYDINPQVLDVARTEFTFLRDTLAFVDVTLGDARLSLEREPSKQFDVLVVDAFSSDAIPIHLLTTEALDVYLKHLRPDGVIAFHVSNRFFDLPPVLELVAAEHGLDAALLVDNPEDQDYAKTDWVLVTADADLLGSEEVSAMAVEPSDIPGLRPWTDDDHNLFQILQ
jgi:SAM-dependent methyltransferase